jgi:hypothetical protein
MFMPSDPLEYSNILFWVIEIGVVASFIAGYGLNKHLEIRSHRLMRNNLHIIDEARAKNSQTTQDTVEGRSVR